LLGLVNAELGAFPAALNCLHRAIALNPTSAAAHYNLGNLLHDLGHIRDAIECYQRALQVEPNFARAHLNLGHAWRDLRDRDRASACYQRALQMMPDCAEAHNDLGVIYREQGRPAEAITCFRRAVRLKPDYFAACGGLIDQLQHVCLWSDLAGLSRHVTDAVENTDIGKLAEPLSPFAFLALPTVTTSAQQHRCARHWVASRFPSVRYGGRPQATALRLARDSRLLRELRGRLAANRKTAPLFDAATFARHLEQAFYTMWQIHSAGEEPRPFRVSC
jgi:tetratricopeptide (TPR) repeat protein